MRPSSPPRSPGLRAGGGGHLFDPDLSSPILAKPNPTSIAVLLRRGHGLKVVSSTIGERQVRGARLKPIALKGASAMLYADTPLCSAQFIS